MEYTRYALYYVPQADLAWAEAATGWLGWDIVAGRAVPPPPLPGLPQPLETITAVPRRYGLHGTIKPPFRLAQGCHRDGLEQACADLCAGLPPLALAGLRPVRMGRFLALCPPGPQAALSGMAATCMRGLDRFRAPMTESELARRASGVPARLAANLARWGHPHVMEAFRFHITLTGNLSPADTDPVEAALARLLVPLLPQRFKMDALALVGEGDDGFFRLLRRFSLSGR